MSGFGVPKASKRSLSQISRDAPSPKRRVSQLKATSYTKLPDANTNGRYDSEEETVLPDDVVDSKLNVLDSNVDIPSSPPFAWTQLGSEQHTVSSAPHSNDDGKSAFMEASNVDVALVAEDPNTSLHGNEVDAIEDDEQDEVMEGDVSSGVHHAWSVMRGLCTHLSHAEVGAINRGLPLHGPPAAAPTTAANALKTRFRWPVRMQNLLRTSFEMSPSPIDVTLDDNADNDDVVNHPDDTSCLPALPEPLCDAVTSEFRRLRPLPAFPPSHELPSKLSHIVRDAAVFADVLMEMLLVRNAAALQGHEQHYSSSAWSSVQGRPTANWKFVVESLDFASSSSPLSLSSETKARIRARLGAIYDDSWMHPTE